MSKVTLDDIKRMYYNGDDPIRLFRLQTRYLKFGEFIGFLEG